MNCLRFSIKSSMALLACLSSVGAETKNSHFGIRIVDQATGRGIPLVELRSVNEIRYVTDNAGWIAFQEPGMMDRDMSWTISGPGIEADADGFGFRCLRAVATPGKTITHRVKYTNIATRVGRLTGQGLYRDSELLQQPCPLPQLTKQGVVGQDSVQAVLYQNKQFWLWGDTSVAQYPLGNFHTTCAWVEPDADPERGISFAYLSEPQEPTKLRRMMPSEKPGAIWIFGLLTIREGNRERMFGGFSRQQKLDTILEKGVAEFDDKTGIFRKVSDVDVKDHWHSPQGHAVLHEGYYYFTGPFAHTRVAATAKTVIDPSQYEAFQYNPKSQQWQWRKNGEPTTQQQESQWLQEEGMTTDAARYQLRDMQGKAIRMHGASIQWNAWRNRWILLGVQSGDKDDPSSLGEVWYAESSSITGPWKRAIKVASHPRYTFYNPVQHAFLQREGGKILYFEGTYTKQFSGNSEATMRYDYNQLMYRLDLSDPRLQSLH